MSGGAILAIIGSVIALLGTNLGMGGGSPESEASFFKNAFSMVYLEEFNHTAVGGIQMLSGQLSALAALATIGLSAAIYKKRKRKLGWAVALLSLVQIGLAWMTYDKVYGLVPCKSLGLAFCDASGGLIPETYVHLNGVVWMAIGAVTTFFGGLVALASFDEYTKEQRFLRVALAWNDEIVVEKVFFVRRPVTIGESNQNVFQVASKGLDSHVLFTPRSGGGGGENAQADEGYTFSAPSGIGGKVTVGGVEQTASGEIAINRGDSGFLSFDNGVDLHFNFTGAQAGALGAGQAQRNTALTVSFATVMAVFMVLFVLANSVAKHEEDTLAKEDLAQKNKGLIEIAVEEKEEEKPEEIKPEGQDEDTTAKKAGGEEGKFGDPDKDPNKQSKVPRMDGPMRDKIDVKNIGIAKVLGGPQAMTGALGNIMAGDTGAISSKMAVAMSGEGGELVIGHGSGGMGFRGTGSGGGGEGYGRLHGLGSIDTGGGTGRNADMGGIGKKAAKKVAKLNIAQGNSTGGCDKGDISKNVKSRASALRACYETQLMTKPDLSGKITVMWTINEEGGVKSDKISADSLNNSAVTDCVLRTIRRIKFMKPEAGTCVVSWPFVFNPG